MAWITVSSDDVRTRLAGPELAALQSAHLASGQADPLPEVIDQVVDEVRGYIAAWPDNRLEEGTKIPSKLLSAALAIIRYRLCTRLPARNLLTDERKREYEDAIRLLERVSDGKFRIEEPVVVEDETVRHPTPSVTPKTRTFDRASQDGI